MNLIRVDDGYQYESTEYQGLIEQYFPGAVDAGDVEHIESICEKLQLSPESLVELVYELNDWMPDTSR